MMPHTKGLAILSVLLCIVPCIRCRSKDYTRYDVLEVTPTNDVQLGFLYELAEDQEMDFWLEPTVVGAPVHLCVPPYQNLVVQEELAYLQMEVTLRIEDIQRLIDVDDEYFANGVMLMGYDWNNYNARSTINTELHNMNADCPEGLQCKAYTLGPSYEGKAMYALSLTKRGQNRKGIWLDSLIDARDWMSAATLMKVANRLVRERDCGEECKESKRLTDLFDWYFMPVMNPDGHDYTWSDDRLWTKSRLPVEKSKCVGTDLNRNYDFKWSNASAVSSSPCARHYVGGSPASDVETQNIQKEARRLGDSLKAWITFQGYGQKILTPFAYRKTDHPCDQPHNHARIKGTASVMAEAIGKSHGMDWATSTSCSQSSTGAGGTVMDYAKSVAGAEYVFQLALRGDSFNTPPDEIEESFTEVWDGIVAMVNKLTESS